MSTGCDAEVWVLSVDLCEVLGHHFDESLTVLPVSTLRWLHRGVESHIPSAGGER